VGRLFQVAWIFRGVETVVKCPPRARLGAIDPCISLYNMAMAAWVGINVVRDVAWATSRGATGPAKRKSQRSFPVALRNESVRSARGSKRWDGQVRKLIQAVRPLALCASTSTERRVSERYPSAEGQATARSP